MSLAGALADKGSVSYAGPSHYAGVHIPNISEPNYSKTVQSAELKMNISEAKLNDVSLHIAYSLATAVCLLAACESITDVHEQAHYIHVYTFKLAANH